MKHSLWGIALAVLATGAVVLAQNQRQKQRPKRDYTRLLTRFDKNKDGVLDKDEVPQQFMRRLAPFDLNKDGKLTKEELQKASGGNKTDTPNTAGEKNTPPARGERYQSKLKAGMMAPDFTLADTSGKKKVTLSSFRGKKPVVLIFGSYT